MGKLKFDINSTYVENTSKGHYGIVDIVFNGVTLASSKQLSATVESLEYDVDILTPSNNILKIALLNDVAYDGDNDNDFTGENDERLVAVVTNLAYSLDGSSYTTLLPQVATSYNISTGTLAGTVIQLTESVNAFNSYGSNHAITFNSDGIVTTEYCQGLLAKVLPNGNVQNLVSGKTYDPDGNEV